MYRLLHIDSSILGEASASRAVGRAFVAAWSAAHPIPRSRAAISRRAPRPT